ncbi:hypothetical protein [Candidatus Frankia alpina]|uniref:Uncharacterized protein n=1 Tax=Candidatus Frankia alpina TaxID=2699483 RepID=A0A4S5CTP8_9ACTN|nr:hypothetical protein [Candidatus Frankia alpina]THJ48185.1 hypothetical protein E7Y31_19365 [Candidatus Frankia alpina]
MTDQRRRVDSAPVTAGRSLIRAAPYGSLALWGGLVAHGLRFATAVAVDVPSNAQTGPVAVPWPPPGVSPSHPVYGSRSPAEEPSTETAASGSAVSRVLLLAPTPFAASLGDEDVATRLNLCGSAPSSGQWVSVAFGGWVVPLPADAWPAAAARFAERHPTTDLFDLGSGWSLLQMEIVEAVVRTARACLLLGAEAAVGLLGGASGPRH